MSKILIVEDEEAIADLERDYLELSGFTVEVANDGDTGLQKALNEDYDLLILDLMLPGTDGFDICRQVREEKNTPIIMVSAKKDDIDKIRGLGLGADDYMTKPFSPSELTKEPSQINYPVVQGADNDLYLHKTFSANENTLGAIFVDAAASSDFTDKNTIIYGHRMKDGSMFRKLEEYKDEDFWKENPYFYIYTPDGERLLIKSTRLVRCLIRPIRI